MAQFYIHYGATKFDPDKFKPIVNHQIMTKPEGGLWASPAEAKFGWKDWCKGSGYSECDEENSFHFSLSEHAKILIINSHMDFQGLPILDGAILGISSASPWVCLDYEQIVKDGVDAIQLNMSNDIHRDDFNKGLYWKLYGWDCDCVLVMNKGVIVVKTPHEAYEADN